MGMWDHGKGFFRDPVTMAVGGAAIGGAAGGIFGRGKKTGLGKASAKQIAFHRIHMDAGLKNFNELFPGLMQTMRTANPTFGALETRALSDANDTSRNARLETAFADRLNQQQGAAGLSRSPTAALRTSFAGLQFGEQLREQAFQNLFNVTQGITQPMAMSFLGASMPGLQQDFGMQGLAMAAGAHANRQSSILSGIQFGGLLGSGFGGGGARIRGGGGGGGGGGSGSAFNFFNSQDPSSMFQYT